MRDYAKLVPSFWTKGSGKKLRGDPAAQVLCLYLFSCPNANMIGLYYVAMPTMCHETGLTEAQVLVSMLRLSELDIAYYDAEAELVFLPEMARYQIGETLSGADKQIKGFEKEALLFRHHEFFDRLIDRYSVPFSLSLEKPKRVNIDSPSKALGRPLEAPSKGLPNSSPPLRSQEQEQEQEQDQDHIVGSSNATECGQKSDTESEKKAQLSKSVREVFDHYLVGWSRVVGGTRKPMLDEKRAKMVKARLAQGFTVDDLKTAVDGLWSRSYNIENGHTTFELVVRSSEQVEKYMGFVGRRSGAITPAVATVGPEDRTGVVFTTAKPPMRRDPPKPPPDPEETYDSSECQFDSDFDLEAS